VQYYMTCGVTSDINYVNDINNNNIKTDDIPVVAGE